MIEGLAQLSGLAQEGLWQAFAVFLRVGAMVSLLPAFGEQSVPVRVKIGLAIAFTAIVSPAVSIPPLNGDMMPYVGLLFAETVTGVFLGLMLRLFVMALQVAGSIAAQSTSLSQIFGAAGMDPLPAMGHVLVVGGLALATIMGLHVQFAAFMIHSYDMVPFGEVIPAGVLSESGIAEISRSFALGFTLAAPFVIASLIYNVILGVINKAMPQLMVAFVGAPAITAGGLIILMLAAPLMLSIWVESMGRFLMDPFRGPS
ncbi:flagellar biosynthetic protein FliR [Pseudooctadecabacter jejudonensis]|uniref:Flagellar biosynthesis protein FliR n=1 Tax=Pseudooctadecabacter jejudonensis TaxID=1391910 RepID=A0A1Y5S3Q2_9RHOB|nr:flagellar biosynthetic protein FliR [Pseudooctadecabacter jejudonensis]SLN32037.1 flagellar biosynthesis protein FliR [Pseudooctadecabacter jejudonensis]